MGFRFVAALSLYVAGFFSGKIYAQSYQKDELTYKVANATRSPYSHPVCLHAIYPSKREEVLI